MWTLLICGHLDPMTFISTNLSLALVLVIFPHPSLGFYPINPKVTLCGVQKCNKLLAHLVTICECQFHHSARRPTTISVSSSTLWLCHLNYMHCYSSDFGLYFLSHLHHIGTKVNVLFKIGFEHKLHRHVKHPQSDWSMPFNFTSKPQIISNPSPWLLLLPLTMIHMSHTFKVEITILTLYRTNFDIDQNYMGVNNISTWYIAKWIFFCVCVCVRIPADFYIIVNHVK